MDERDAGGQPARPAAPSAPVRRKRAMPRNFHFSMGEALSRTMACYGKNLPVLTLFGLMLYVPLGILLLNEPEDTWLVRLVQQGSPWFVQAVVTLGVFQYLRGQGMQYGRSFGRGMERFFPVLGIAIITALLMIAAAIPAVIVITALARSASGLLAGVIAGLLMLCVIVGITCVFFVSVQAAIVERIGPARAMSRSSSLTRGARWKIFGVILIFGIIAFVLQMIVNRVLLGDFPTLDDWRVYVIVSTAVTAVFSVLQAVAATVIYHDLRRAKEGVDLDELMRVFG